VGDSSDVNETLNFRLLGGLEITGVSGSGGSMTRKARAILAYLAVRGNTGQSRDGLAAMFWRDSPEPQARTNLRQALSSIRRFLGTDHASALLTEQDKVVLDPARRALDTELFEAAARASEAAVLEGVGELYRGDFLDGFSLNEDEFERWAQVERERNRQLASSCLKRLLIQHESKREVDSWMVVASTMLRLDPVDESAHRALMRGYAAQDRTAMALKQYEQCRTALERELAVEPRAETTDLFRTIRQMQLNRPPRGRQQREATISLADAPSLAVLPFANLSEDPGQEYFSDGVTEDIITELCRFSTLLVTARASSFSYKGRNATVQEIAGELGVRYLLDGSIRRFDDRVRITTQLVDCRTGAHVWAERYDGVIDEIFDFQDEITRSVVSSLAPQIEMAEIERARGLKEANISAYDQALKAKALLFDGAKSMDATGIEQSIRAADIALEADPRSLQALWTQGFAYHLLSFMGRDHDPDATAVEAASVARKLSEIDSTNPYCCMIVGIACWDRGEHDEALDHLRRGHRLNPNFAWNLFSLAWCESLAGLSEDAIRHAELGLKLSPRDMDFWLGTAYLSLAQAYFAERNFPAAKEMAIRALELSPDAPLRNSIVVASCAFLGDTAEADIRLRQLAKSAPRFVEDLISGRYVLYSVESHNELLVQGMRMIHKL
jgi:TolB-like protein